VDDKDPLQTIDLLRKPENLPNQYRSEIYDNSLASIKQFVFILNDQSDEFKLKRCRDTISKQFNDNIIFDVKMTHPLSSAASISPIQGDFWGPYLDLDARAFNPNRQFGLLFT
jgi:hypothetical protein